MADIMNLEILQEATVRAAEQYLSERDVEWLSITEAPVENFVRKNELVLTTGIGCDHDMDVFKQFVHDVVESGASGLAIATGRFIFDIPYEILEIAEKNGFPIIELPWELRFADISHQVMQELTKKQQYDLGESKKIQEQLLNLILNGEGLTEVAKFVSKKINQPIIITDKHCMIKGIHPVSRSLSDKWGALVESSVLPLMEDEATFSRDPLQMKVQTVEHSGQPVIQLPIIKSYNRIQGYLYVLPKNKRTDLDDLLNRYVSNILEHAVTTAAFWFLRENAIEETEVRLRDDFVTRLALEPIESWERVVRRGKVLGYNIELPFVCIVATLEKMEVYYHKVKNVQGSYQEWLQSMVHYIEEELIHSAQSLQRQLMVTNKNEELILFLETTSGDSSYDSVNDFLDLVDRRLTNLLPDLNILWAIGSQHERPNQFYKSYKEAKLSLYIGKKKGALHRRIHYYDTTFERAILSLMKNDEMIDIVSATIYPLVQYDEKKENDLIKTFNVFFNHQCNVSKTARALNLHRQTLLYRLRKIESLTGLSLNNSDHLFLLTLSLKVWSIGLANDKKG